MASVSIDEESNKGRMWDLDQNLDQPMEEEAGRLKNMYREKVRCGIYILTLIYRPKILYSCGFASSISFFKL